MLSGFERDGMMRLSTPWTEALAKRFLGLDLYADHKYANTWTARAMWDSPLIDDALPLVILGQYYGRSPVMRNNPLIQFIKATEDTEHDMLNSNWHVDHLHQVSMMLLLSEVTEQTMHMEYAVGSHRGLKLEGYYDDKQIRSQFPILKLTGKPGTLYMFDTAGVHRANYLPNTSRKILHLNFTTGHDLSTDGGLM